MRHLQLENGIVCSLRLDVFARQAGLGSARSIGAAVAGLSGHIAVTSTSETPIPTATSSHYPAPTTTAWIRIVASALDIPEFEAQRGPGDWTVCQTDGQVFLR